MSQFGAPLLDPRRFFKIAQQQETDSCSNLFHFLTLGYLVETGKPAVVATLKVPFVIENKVTGKNVAHQAFIGSQSNDFESFNLQDRLIHPLINDIYDLFFLKAMMFPIFEIDLFT